MSEIIDLNAHDAELVDRLADITFSAFRESAPGWIPTIDLARNQVVAAGAQGRRGRVMIQEGQAIAWIGLIEGRHVWEIHPLAVATDHQYKGIGHMLVEDVSHIAKAAGALTLFAGTSDEDGTTNLFGLDLYANPVNAIKHLQATGRSHTSPGNTLVLPWLA